jgi:hypothetical protein
MHRSKMTVGRFDDLFDHLVGARAVELVQIAGGATGHFAALLGRLPRWTARCRSGMLSDVLTSH